MDLVEVGLGDDYEGDEVRKKRLDTSMNTKKE